MENGWAKTHQRVSTGDVVRVICRRESGAGSLIDSIEPSDALDVDHEQRFLFITSLHQVGGSALWACGINLKSTGRSSQYNLRLHKESVQAFRVTLSMTVCAALHNCDEDKGCSFIFDRRRYCHKLNYEHDVSLFVLTGSTGFPFRSA